MKAIWTDSDIVTIHICM